MKYRPHSFFLSCFRIVSLIALLIVCLIALPMFFLISFPIVCLTVLPKALAIVFLLDFLTFPI
ncbi:MAG: hypothetical protein ACI4DK_08250 [Lachnospiraceae bacterium]